MKKQIRVGRWVRVKWDDVGAKDCVIVSKEGSTLTVYEPFEKDTSHVEVSQVILVGNDLDVSNSGL